MIEILGVKLHAYGLLIGIGVYLAWEITRKLGKIEEKELDKIFFGLIFFGVLGARAYHVIDLWQYYSKNFIEIFYLWNGGLGIWGALLGGIAYLSYYSYFNKLNLLKLLDSVVIGVPLAQAIGRLGNWVNGELYGKNGEPLFAWEAGLNLILFGLLVYFSKKNKHIGFLTGLYFLGYGVIRIYLENFRPNSIIWRTGGIPTAIIFGVVAVASGIFLIQKRPTK